MFASIFGRQCKQGGNVDSQTGRKVKRLFTAKSVQLNCKVEHWAKHPLEHSHIIILDGVQWTGTCFRWQISKSKFVSKEKR